MINFLKCLKKIIYRNRTLMSLVVYKMGNKNSVVIQFLKTTQSANYLFVFSLAENM